MKLKRDKKEEEDGKPSKHLPIIIDCLCSLERAHSDT